MSLRRDIHSAFEDIAPPLGGMPERVVQTVLADKRRRRKERMVYRLRFHLALVAAVLLVAVAVAALLTWNTLHNNVSPAGHVHLTSLQELEARSWQHEVVGPRGQCSGQKVNGSTTTNSPVRANGTDLRVMPWGEYSTGYAIFQKGFSGLLIVRVRDGRSGTNHFFLNENAGGPVVGTVDMDGQTVQRHAEAVFDLSDPSVRTGSDGVKAFTIHEGHLNGFSACFEWQYDGTYQGQPFWWHWYFSG